MIPFLLSFIASMGTFLGGILTIILVKYMPAGSNHNTHTNNLLGILQSFSAGVMLFMTFIDLMPEARESLGSYECNLWFFVGVVVFGLLEWLILPAAEPTDVNRDVHTNGTVTGTGNHSSQHNGVAASNGHADGDVQITGSPSATRKRRGRTASSPTRNKLVKCPTTSSPTNANRKALLRTSLVTFVAMGLHNLPEGLSVYLGALADFRLGLQLAAAICLHNIPEGMAVAIPLWAATKSTWHVLLMTLINGLLEPMGVVIGGYFLGSYLNQAVLSKSLAAVAGIMACISIHELFPTAIHYAGKDKASIALFAGMAVCFVALEGVDLLMAYT
ncbi:hypothetical protein SeMB42_g01650 [Synchytrium endobioticum]|nr:hypothetical protein SeMB42_g01650 [Synchytrium endobioticum]